MREDTTMGYKKFSDIAGDIDSDRRARIDAIKEEAHADIVAFNLGELRRAREMTQVELAQRLERAQASISAMEHADDNLVSTVRSVVESMGGRLELVAVFDEERIAIAPKT
ncbi:MAG: XRE family transcriptional regulator [Acidimicrobiia bacterium]|jgi:DNA-binding phage protein|nr:XRE family transcriptional regulator [Acidimicrobiia bacterium]